MNNVIPAWRLEERRQAKEREQIQVVEYEGRKMTWEEFMRICSYTSFAPFPFDTFDGDDGRPAA